MTPGAPTVTEDMPAREIARLLFAKNISRVRWCAVAKLVGILARSDLIRTLAQKLAETPADQVVSVESRE